MKSNSFRIIKGLLFILFASFCFLSIESILIGAPDPGSIILASGFAFGNLDWAGGDNMGGFTSEAYLAISKEIVDWPTLPSNPVTDADLVTLTGTYTFVEGKSFYKIYVTPRTFGGDSDSQGEIDGKSLLQKGEFFYPGTHTEALAFVRKMNNARGVLIGIDPNNGNRIQFGSKEFPLFYSVKVSFGKTATDRRGVTVEYETDHTHGALIYPGAIAFSGGELPATS